MENNENCENSKKFSFDVCNKEREDYSDGFNENITISVVIEDLDPIIQAQT